VGVDKNLIVVVRKLIKGYNNIVARIDVLSKNEKGLTSNMKALARQGAALSKSFEALAISTINNEKGLSRVENNMRRYFETCPARLEIEKALEKIRGDINLVRADFNHMESDQEEEDAEKHWLKDHWIQVLVAIASFAAIVLTVIQLVVG
jgi:hypothetical protein